ARGAAAHCPSAASPLRRTRGVRHRGAQVLLSTSRGVGEGYPLRRYARLVGAPNCAPSLCSVAGLLLALALKSRFEDTLTLLTTRIDDCVGDAAQWKYAISLHRAVARRAKLGLPAQTHRAP
ncbi:MAG TPA: hypothetical protein VK560_03640, partial [Gemmatimonadaceae bacterium]|nr:hypothetical protein [Gemmatimonadaceae bacterium]